MAENVTCPACGAPVDGSARHCSFCNAPVATVRCAGCFQMASPNAVYCPGCGRPLGLEPIAAPEASLTCPHCPGHLAAFGGEPGRLYDCSSCGGQFVEHALIRDLLERREVCGASVPRRASPAPVLHREPVKYVPCPSCRALMNRQNFGGKSGIIVDLCAKHGIWFDSGELPRVLEFVESGGLARERQRQLDQLRQRARAEVVDQSHVRLTDSHLEDASWDAAYWKDGLELVMTLLHDVGAWMARHH
ncbi:MAG TPA: zinc ribbon domain-containing protein [Polyangiaceae bacterium]